MWFTPKNWLSPNLGERDSEQAGRRSRGDDDIGPLDQQDARELRGENDEAPAVPPRHVAYGVEPVVRDLLRVVRVDADEGHVHALEGRVEAPHLDPVPAAACHGQDSLAHRALAHRK
jgi:hypothetical protein